MNKEQQTKYLFEKGHRKGEINSGVCTLEYYTLHDFYVEVLILDDGSYGELNAFVKKVDYDEIAENFDEVEDDSQITLEDFNHLCQEEMEQYLFHHGEKLGEIEDINRKGTVEFWIMPNFYAELFVEPNGYRYKLRGFNDRKRLKNYEKFLDIVSE